MEKRLSKYWNPEKEELAQLAIDGSHSFAMRHLIMSVRDILKYDHRTREGSRADALARLRIATATDEELEELAKLEFSLLGVGSEAETIERLKKHRSHIRETGIKRKELEWP